MNNIALRYALFFAGGLVAGVVGAMAVTRGSLNLAPCVDGLVSRGRNVRDALSSTVEKVKEDAQDLLAEAKDAQSRRRAR